LNKKETSLKRQQFESRQWFTREERDDILDKTDYHCAHCGKYIYGGKGEATIDHFIPLFRGGTNRSYNLIPLCYKCNQEKADKIMGLSYIQYLREPYMTKLADYYNSYMRCFDYTARDRLLAKDEYEFEQMTSNVMNKYKRADTKKQLGVRFKIKYATYDDFERICDFYEKYLKKYGRLKDRETVESNIGFWMQFGCIYYMEKYGEIYLMCALTIKTLNDESNFQGINKSICLYLFPYYANDLAHSVTANLIEEFQGWILEEQHLTLLNTTVKMLKEDRVAPSVLTPLSKRGTGHPWERKYKYDLGCDGNFYVVNTGLRTFYGNGDDWTDGREKLKKYYAKFDDIEDKLKEYIEEYDDITWQKWMIYDLLPPERADELLGEEG